MTKGRSSNNEGESTGDINQRSRGWQTLMTQSSELVFAGGRKEEEWSARGNERQQPPTSPVTQNVGKRAAFIEGNVRED